MNKNVIIAGTGSYLPVKILSNEELSSRLHLSVDWIVRRTGINERRIAASNQATSDLALIAALRAIEKASVDVSALDLIIVATSTPDTIFPSTACRLQASLGARLVPSFDLSASCSGFLYALKMGENYIKAGCGKHVLIVGAEVRSRFTDFDNKETAVLYGDGAGAVVLSEATEPGIMDIILGSDGSGADLLQIPGGGSLYPASIKTVEQKMHYVQFKKYPLSKAAISKLTAIISQQLADNKIKAEDLALIIPHQMNKRIIESIANRLNIAQDKFKVNIDRVGNTSAASIPLALDEAVCNGSIARDDLILLVAFGGGLTWGGALVKF